MHAMGIASGLNSGGNILRPIYAFTRVYELLIFSRNVTSPAQLSVYVGHLSLNCVPGEILQRSLPLKPAVKSRCYSLFGVVDKCVDR